jgi:hypothetical protein
MEKITHIAWFLWLERPRGIGRNGFLAPECDIMLLSKASFAFSYF